MSEPAGQAAVAVPRGARGARTRARLLEAARTSFATTGWSRARVEDVCRAAGVGHATLYAYFGNRTEILEALVRRHADALDAVVEDSTWSAPCRHRGRLRSCAVPSSACSPASST